MNEYEEKAQCFAEKTGTKLVIIDHTYGAHFLDDKKQGVSRHIFRCRLERNKKSYTFEFGQSLADGSKQPTMYDVLSCLQKYDVGTFENFCADYGYDEDSRTAEKVYKEVVREWKAVERLFGDVLNELQEIM